MLAIATGLADWQHLNGRDRRTGLVHGAINVVSTGLNLLSVALRVRGRPGTGRLVSGTAFLAAGASSYLGAHLIYRRGNAVDHADRSREPRDFVAVLPLAELEDRVPRRVAVWDEVARKEIGIVLVRQGGRVHAMGARCSHAGGSLDQGWVADGALVCPWHGSGYDLETGQPTTGPSTCPQPCYQARLREGRVEVRREQEPGDPVVTSETLAKEAGTRRGDGNETAHPKATEVLSGHHELIRRLFGRLLDVPGEDPQRHALLHTLAAELDIHEAVEDAILDPAVSPVSEDVDIAYAEHGVLADMVGAIVKLPTQGAAFEDALRALGRQLEDRLDAERTSRFRRSFRNLKINLMAAA